MTESTKKGFDFARNSIYVADPTELTLVGGKGILPAEQSSSRDTADDPEHELWDPRLRDQITEEEIANVDAFGVLEPVLISKEGDLAVVVDGRGRVRRARAANKRRKARGEPLIKVSCVVVRQRGTALMGPMIAANEVRRDDSLPGKIEKAKRVLARGVSEDDTAVMFGVKASTLRSWLAYEDNATAEVKRAVEAGAISQTAGLKLATKVKDPEKQRETLAGAVAGSRGKPATVNEVRRSNA